MISRVAEHCFWMSRYLERAENTARVLEVNQTLLLDFDVPLEQQWKPLLIISGIHDMPGEPDAERVQNYMTWEPDNPSSIASSLAAARENARIIREVISADMWERMNFYYLWMQGPGAATSTTPTAASSTTRSSASTSFSTASAKGRCRTARRGSSSSWASTSNAPARRPASST